MSHLNCASLEARRNELERERLQVQADIIAYPTPIPGCDVYFNDLLERRARVCAELTELDQAIVNARS